MKDLVFDKPTLTPPLSKGGAWTLANDWTVVFRGEYYHIAAGFGTDGASIPRALWWVCGTPLETPRLFAALLHDFLYSGGDPEATRKDADDIYREVQVALGICRLKAWVEWTVLRLFGWIHWKGAAPVRGSWEAS